MSRPACERFCNGLGDDKVYRSISLNNASRITCATKLLISSTAADKFFKTQRVIPRGPALEQRVKERTTVVYSKFENLQRLVDSTRSFLCFNKSRCLQEGVG